MILLMKSFFCRSRACVYMDTSSDIGTIRTNTLSTDHVLFSSNSSCLARDKKRFWIHDGRLGKQTLASETVLEVLIEQEEVLGNKKVEQFRKSQQLANGRTKYRQHRLRIAAVRYRNSGKAPGRID